MSTLGWLSSVSSCVFVLTTLVEAIVKVARTEFAFTNWQYTLLMLAFLAITIGFKTWGAKILPMLETVSLFGHMAGFLVTIILIWVMAPKNSAKAVFTEIKSNGGWSNKGVSCLISQISVLYTLLGKLSILNGDGLPKLTFIIGSDSAVHICE